VGVRRAVDGVGGEGEVMRRAPKLRYPSADYARLTGGEKVAYYIAGIFAFEAIVVAVMIAIGFPPAVTLTGLIAIVVTHAALSLAIVTVVRRRHLRRKRERAELVAALAVETG
jgi:ABC-type spermidine/putrescine transport system permease subunit II